MGIFDFFLDMHGNSIKTKTNRLNFVILFLGWGDLPNSSGDCQDSDSVMNESHTVLGIEPRILLMDIRSVFQQFEQFLDSRLSFLGSQ